ncbi:hypothetical protein ACLK1S_25450 [Escherichia coli]
MRPLDNPILPVLFLLLRRLTRCGGSADRHGNRQRETPIPRKRTLFTVLEIPVVSGEICLLVAFFAGLAMGDDGKVRALVAASVVSTGRGGSGLVSPGWG